MEALESAYLLPRSVHDVLPDATAAGLCGPPPADAAAGAPPPRGAGAHGWVLHRSTLLVWRADDDAAAAVRRLQLPQAPSGRVFVSIIPHAGSSALTVVLCTAAGLLCVWLDAHFFAPPYTQQLFVGPGGGSAGAAAAGGAPAAVSAVATAAADAAGAPGFAAVVSTADGALHLYHGSQKGIFPRQFHRPSASSAAAAGAGDGSSTTAGAGASILGSLGGVVKALYSEAFDPLYRVQRASPSRLPARQLLLLRSGAAGGGGAAWRLLALSPDALDCWALGAANNASAADERLVWSFNLRGVLLSELAAADVEPLALAVAYGGGARGSGGGAHASGGGGARLLVWSAFAAQGSVDASRHALSAFSLPADSIPQHERSAAAGGGAAGALPRPAAAGGAGAAGWRLLAHPAARAALAKAPNGAVVEWSLDGLDDEHCQVLASGFENIDAACCADRDLWQILNAKYGVLLMRAGGGAGADAAAPEGGLSEAAVVGLLDATVGLMVREYEAGNPYAELAEGLGNRLARLGLFGGGAAAAGLVVGYSSSIADQMPKEGAAGAGGAAALQEALGRKALRHDMLLAALESGGALARLPAAATAAAFSHAQQLAAAGAALELLPELAAAAQDGGAGAAEAQAAAMAALSSAGALAAAGAPEPALREWAPWEPFFARPTAGAPGLFTAAAAAAGELCGELAERAAPSRGAAAAGGGEAEGADAAAARLRGLSALLLAAAAGAARKGAQLAAAFGGADARARGAAAAAGGGWLCSEGARAAWDQIAQACLLLKPRLPGLQQRLSLDASAHLPAAAALLAATRDALRAAAARAGAGGGAGAGAGGAEGARAALEAAYALAREEHVGTLLEDARAQLEELRAAGALPPADDAGVAAASGALVWRVEELAMEHGCHAQLFDTLQLLLAAGLDDAGRLLRHMRRELESPAAAADPHATFTRYAMDRLRREGRVRELLQLGREGFAPQLLPFLSAHPHLLWLAEAGAGRWADATDALLLAAQSVQDSCAERRRMMALAKLSSLAASPAPDAFDARHPRRAAAHRALRDQGAGGAGAAATAAAARRVEEAGRRAAGELLGLRAQGELGLEGGAGGDAAPLGAGEMLADVLVGAGGAPAGEEGARVAAALAALAAAPAELRDANSALWEAGWQRLLELTDMRALAELQAAQLGGGASGDVTGDVSGDGGETAGGGGGVYEEELRASPLFCGLVACAAALVAAAPADSRPSPAEVLDGVGAWLRARAAGDRALGAALEATFNAAADAAAPLLTAAADA